MLTAYRNWHLWLLIPFCIALVGFVPSYWLKFGEVPFHQHLHGLTATVWYLIVILQPYLITRGNAKQHRRYGMMALFVAGGVAVSAAMAIPHTFSGSLPDAAKYVFAFIDSTIVIGFSLAVIMAIRAVKRTDDHARWMISTVFWTITPAFFRVVFIVAQAVNSGEVPDGLTGQVVLTLTGALNILVLVWLMGRERRAHPAYVLAAIGSISFLVTPTIADWDWWRNVADAVFRA